MIRDPVVLISTAEKWTCNLGSLLLQPEDEGEKFDRLQMELLMNNPDSAAFYNAKMRTQRRVRPFFSMFNFSRRTKRLNEVKCDYGNKSSKLSHSLYTSKINMHSGTQVSPRYLPRGDTGSLCLFVFEVYYVAVTTLMTTFPEAVYHQKKLFIIKKTLGMAIWIWKTHQFLLLFWTQKTIR